MKALQELESQIARAQRVLAKGDAAEALTACSQLLAVNDDIQPKLRVELLYLQAVAQRLLAKAGGALATLEKLNRIQPESGRAAQERGLLALAAQRPAEALPQFILATRYNPGLLQSWKRRASLHAHFGHREGVILCETEISALEALPPELAMAKNLYHEEAYLKAEAVCKEFMRANPQHLAGMRLLADIAAALGAPEEAEFLLASAIEFAPNDPQVRIDYIQALKKRQKFDAAFAQAAALVERWPDQPRHKSIYAIEYMQLGKHREALELFDEILELLPDDPSTHVSRGHAFRVLGDNNEAVAAYRQATTLNQTIGDAWFSLSNLKTYKFTDDEIRAMEGVIAQPMVSYSDRINIHFALGKAYEDAGQYEKAFSHYDDGNEAKKRQIGYAADVMQAELQAQKAACTPALFEKQGGKGHGAPDPIFIVGLPRAGSTLIEQILASHSQIDGTLELPNILSLAHRLRGKKRSDSDSVAYPENLHELSGEELEQMGRDFIADTQLHRQGAAFFTDKMPNNFRHIGLIHLILPNAKIIDARRDPMDCCFSGFKQLFAQGQEFTYGLEEIGRYYADYVALMEHWHAVLPGKILHVQHEDVLDDLDGQVARMLDYLGLPFEQACLDFHTTERAVRTASSAQVRQPLNRKGVGAWRPFEPYLDPLKQALGPHYDAARYQQDDRHE
jgi:tetratricopeptide (TPR) repeat protein